ncbi:MAG TPA: hypothetical protein VGH56_01125 [Solirubrobacteraceae bacterium]
MGDGEGWETVTREGIEMRTRPATWGQAQVELEREGTLVHLMSDNLTRDQVLTIAADTSPGPPGFVSKVLRLATSMSVPLEPELPLMAQ